MSKSLNWQRYAVLGKLALTQSTMRSLQKDKTLPAHLSKMAEQIEGRTLILDKLLREHLGAKPK
jgi:hypothetical protein